jgi:hypothetical protein
LHRQLNLNLRTGHLKKERNFRRFRFEPHPQFRKALCSNGRTTTAGYRLTSLKVGLLLPSPPFTKTLSPARLQCTLQLQTLPQPQGVQPEESFGSAQDKLGNEGSEMLRLHSVPACHDIGLGILRNMSVLVGPATPLPEGEGPGVRAVSERGIVQWLHHGKKALSPIFYGWRERRLLPSPPVPTLAASGTAGPAKS